LLPPLDGVSALFVGPDEELQLSFWSSATMLDSEPRFYDYSIRVRGAHFDWSAHPLAVVLELLDSKSHGGYCVYDDLGGVTRISGRVTSLETGLPIANVLVSTGGAPVRTDADGRYSGDVLSKYGDKPGATRISFDAGPGYRVAFWRDAATAESATKLTIGAERNIAYMHIDARMVKSGLP
jgi:hypothetical protein